MEFLLISIIAMLGWGIRIIRIELKSLEVENFELQKSNKELLEVNYKLTKKQQ